MSHMFFLILRIDKDIVQVNNNKFIEDSSHGLIDICLECSRCITQTKWHNGVFKLSISSVEHHLPFITSTNVDTVVGVTQV